MGGWEIQYIWMMNGYPGFIFSALCSFWKVSFLSTIGVALVWFISNCIGSRIDSALIPGTFLIKETKLRNGEDEDIVYIRSTVV